jgi:hypothetical protein
VLACGRGTWWGMRTPVSYIHIWRVYSSTRCLHSFKKALFQMPCRCQYKHIYYQLAKLKVLSAFCFLSYVDSRARHDETTKSRDSKYSLVVDIACENLEESRWRAAAFTQCQAWQETMQPSFCSSWSIRLESSPEFPWPSKLNNFPLSDSGPFSKCLRLCGQVLLTTQTRRSDAALAAILLLPSMGYGRI